jgi:Flp pilus assembly protein TadG
MRKAMRRAIIKTLRNESGGPLVETALTFPILIMLLIGPIELGRVAYGAIECTNAARAAASYGSQTTATVADTPGIQAVAQRDGGNISSVLSTSVLIPGVCADGRACSGACADGSPSCTADLQMCLNTDCTGSQVETNLVVTTTATIPALVQLPGLPKSYTVHGKAVQKVLRN